LRRLILALAHFTGWSLAEIDDMDFDDFVEWCDELPRPEK
jgi:hypothetical protein